MRREPTTRAAVGATLVAAVLWGTSFVVNDAGLRDVGPATFATLRFALAGAVMLAALGVLRRLDASFLSRPWFWLLAAFNALGFLLQYVGQTLTTPARTALFVNCSAFTVALIERFAFGQRLGGARAAALVAGLAGAALLVTRGDVGSLEGGQLVGDLLVLASGLAWAIYFVLNQRALRHAEPWSLVAWTFAATSVLLVPSLLLDVSPLAVGAAWPAILYAGIATTAIAYTLWAFGLRRIRATTSAVLLLVEILVASALSVAIGRESFGPWDLAGAALLVASVVAMAWLEARTAAPDEGPAARAPP